jgi:hypothetical protein
VPPPPKDMVQKDRKYNFFSKQDLNAKGHFLSPSPSAFIHPDLVVQPPISFGVQDTLVVLGLNKYKKDMIALYEKRKLSYSSKDRFVNWTPLNFHSSPLPRTHRSNSDVYWLGSTT